MDIAINIILLVLGAAIIALYTWRGFFKALMSFVRLILASLLSCVLTPILFDDWMALGYLLIFVIFYLIFTLILRLLDKIIKKLPIIKTANRILGFLFGCFCAYIILSAATVAISLVTGGSANGLLYDFFENYGAFSIINN